MRIAWIGDASAGGGVGGMARQFLEVLPAEGVEVDWYFRGHLKDVRVLDEMVGGGELRCFSYPFAWNWHAWYGRNPKIAFLMAFAKRLASSKKMAVDLIREHRQIPYDVVIQFSQGELVSLKPYARELPIVLYTCVHAAGELRWCRNEEDIARQCESWWWRKFRFMYLRYRSYLQSRDYNAVRGVIGMSHRFNELVQEDYGLHATRQGVVYHPIDYHRSSAKKRLQDGKIRLLFVGRISVRKGLEVLLEALPEILESSPSVEIVIIGAGSLWSNYEPLLRSLPRDRCRWLRSIDNDDVVCEMENADILLIPSSYEPGGIVIGEALSAGMVIVASTEVGSAENLPPSVCWQFPPRNSVAFANAVLAALTAVRLQGQALREDARAICVKLFDSSKVTQSLVAQVKKLVGTNKSS